MVDHPLKRIFLKKEFLIPSFSAFLVLALWEVLAKTGIIGAYFFPPPTLIGKAMLKIGLKGDLFHHTLATLCRLLLAFFMASIPGVAIGLAMGLWRTVRSMVDPLILLLYPIPSIAFLPMIMLYFGFGDLSLLITAAITPFFLITINTMAGVSHLEKVILEAGQNYGALGWKLFYKVIFPGTLPYIFTGFRLGLGLALIIVIAVELVAAKVGLGSMLWTCWQIFKIEEMYCGLIIIGVMGLFFTYGLGWVADSLMPWQKDILRQKGLR